MVQLLASSTDLAPYILDNYANNGLRPSKKILMAIIGELILSLDSVRLLVDGLDEWPHRVQEEVLDDLSN